MNILWELITDSNIVVGVAKKIKILSSVDYERLPIVLFNKIPGVSSCVHYMNSTQKKNNILRKNITANLCG